jgi:hypothetical protein
MSNSDKPSKAKQEITRIEHDGKGARDVAKAKVNATIAEAEAAVAEKKREIEKRIDDARVNARKNK